MYDSFIVALIAPKLRDSRIDALGDRWQGRRALGQIESLSARVTLGSFVSIMDSHSIKNLGRFILG